MRELSKGAEATLFLEKNRILKKRIAKRYRHAKIDSHLRKIRTSAEARLLNRARRAGANTPRIYSVGKYDIEMERIKGERFKELMQEKERKEITRLLERLGREIALLHNNDLIHGDLTTSNILLEDDRIYFIDFGLGEVSKSIEKRSTDLKLLKNIIKSTHSKYENEFKYLLKGYRKKADNADEVLARLENIEQRGRYVKRKAGHEQGKNAQTGSEQEQGKNAQRASKGEIK